ncbi:tRNA U-34 5-methylaminomethyl-2-thiouridine biosynthesis protein [Rhodococcus sp. ABRD24]|uniref:DODA-type extradiol aromatic ring-opening family dioxygenase n=1 Tax=Rhodococcus sp. ABRD24 TaxID=2507582 RepID=UPI00103E360C|nr:tRNA U-34 5-methylaminomethyl-2-thiouridine biosynthesis protein [Rhodococcus sp. ABRD24]QBJ96487.1 tRNA U-34 5-methylaminomethyl-2-thiouridine biosynthesis protein [Rhodococcus sp. ABRD24]
MKSNVKSAYLIPGSPLPLLRSDAVGLRPIVEGLDRARKSLEAAAPDTVIVYSTGWIAVVDQMWLTRPHMTGRFVDGTWHEFGHIDWEIDVAVPIAERAIASTEAFGIKSRGCDYDGFPIDAGTIVFSKSMNATASIPLVVTSNNLYHDWEITRKIGQVAVETAAAQGKTVSIVGIGGLSGSIFRDGVDFDNDRIYSPEDDAANGKLIELVTSGDVERLEAYVPEYSKVARADMGMKHLGFLLGALGGTYSSAECLGYGPLCGSGGAVVEFTP